MRRLTYRIPVLPLLAGLCLLLIAGPHLAEAQRPLRLYDPFYRNETARRVFFDRYAFTAEVSYRPAGSLQDDGFPSPNADPLALALRFDYQLGQRFDLSVLMDAVGGTSGRKLSVSWIALKYYRTVDRQDYAFRLAVDPASDGRVGFPQMDLAFLYTSLMTPALSTDFAIGLRRIRIGYQQLDPDEPLATVTQADREVVRTRALGWEVHVMSTYNILFDPAGSNLFVTFLGEGGRYDLVELGAVAPTPENTRSTTTFRGGVFWIRTGIELDRPNYQLAPYLAVPVKQWAPTEGVWPTSRLHVGLRLMLR